MMQLIYLSPVPWASFAQRPHKFVEWFHKNTGGEVLWIDPYPTRLPLLSDFHRSRTQSSKKNYQNPSWLKLFYPFALPIEPLMFSGIVNGIIWRMMLNKIDRYVNRNPTILVIGKPSLLALIVLKRLGEITSVYDAMDNFPSFYSGVSRLAMSRRERKLIKRVTHIITSSTILKQRWHSIRPDIQLVRNGLDINIMPAPKNSVSGQRSKIFGYVGTIGHWFDWEWIIALAQARPLDIVRLIGPMFAPPPYVLPANVEIFPPCVHSKVLEAMRNFDVGLIPFKNNDLTTAIDPIKYYEYRALGLPIVSTIFGEMKYRGNEDGVFLCKEVKEINNLIQAALQYIAKEETIRSFTDDNTWDARFSVAIII